MGWVHSLVNKAKNMFPLTCVCMAYRISFFFFLKKECLLLLAERIIGLDGGVPLTSRNGYFVVFEDDLSLWWLSYSAEFWFNSISMLFIIWDRWFQLISVLTDAIWPLLLVVHASSQLFGYFLNEEHMVWHVPVKSFVLACVVITFSTMLMWWLWTFSIMYSSIF